MWSIDRIVEEASHLSPDEQAELVARLWDNIPEDACPSLSPAWKAEIADRIAEYERGEATTIPWETVLNAAQERLASRQDR